MIKSHVAGWALGSPTPAQLKEFFAQIENGRITKVSLQAFLREGDISFLVSSWRDFYNYVFGLGLDFSELRIPKRKKGFDQLIIVAKEVTIGTIFQKCEELFYCHASSELDDAISYSDRSSKDGSYAIWFQSGGEIDESLVLHDSGNRLILALTLEERFLLELKHFNETGRHLYIQSLIHCMGSHGSGGVPTVWWNRGTLSIRWDGKKMEEVLREDLYKGASFYPVVA